MDRYINVNEAIKTARKSKAISQAIADIIDFQQVIDDTPTADVIEVKHGRWVYDPDGMDWNIGAWRCSECGCKNGNLGSYSSTNPYHCAGSKFCPHCGAKMTGDIKPTEICLSTGLECSKCTPGPCSSRKQV